MARNGSPDRGTTRNATIRAGEAAMDVDGTLYDPNQLSFESSEAATQRPQDLPIQYSAFSWRSPLANTQDVTSTTPIRQPQEATPDISLKTKYQQGVSAEEAAAGREFAATWFLDPLPVCPTTRSLLPASLTSLSKNEAKLRRGRDGKIRIVYPDDSDDDEIRPAHVKSMRVKQPETQQQLETYESDLIECIKMLQKGQRGFTTDCSNSKVKVGDSGQYRVGSECADLKTLLGRGTSDVLLVRDNVTGQEHAIKTVSVDKFQENGLLCWRSVKGSDYFPHLYIEVVIVKNAEVVFHMERIEGVTLDHLLNECLDKDFRIRNPIAMKYFSFWVLHGVLMALDELIAQSYNHNDLHAANLMIQREPIKLRVLDLELAQPLDELNKKMLLKCDILNTVRLFCAVSLRTTIGDPNETEKQLQQFSQHEGPLYKLFLESPFLDDETKSFVYNLLNQLHGYLQQGSAHTLQGITHCIEQQLFPGLPSSDCREKMAEMFSEVFAEFLIPGIQDLNETAPAATPDTAEEPSISDEQLLQFGLNKPSEPAYE